MIDSLGDRMKQQYENRTRFMLPRRTYTIIRCDGKAFHTLTRGMDKPFDENFMYCMDAAAAKLCEQVQGAAFAYVQSDEISVLLTDFEKTQTQSWFDGNVQKMVSVSASICTAAFNRAMHSTRVDFRQLGLFDSRVFIIPDRIEVMNYFIWRQKDWERNSLMSLCLAHYSPKQMAGKSRSEQHEMLFAKGVNWNNLPTQLKRGRIVAPYAEYIPVVSDPGNPVRRTRWAVDKDMPVLRVGESYLDNLVPVMEAETEVETETA